MRKLPFNNDVGAAVLSGVGVLFCRGRGTAALEQAAREGWRAPTPVAAAFHPDGTSPAYPVDLAACGDRDVLSRLRRADRFSQFAALAALDAVRDASPAGPLSEHTGIIVATALGPHATAFRFLDEILTYGDEGPSALVFSHSVHNAAAAYIANLLGLQGPAVTIAQTDFAFHQALMLADSWLAEDRCEHVLVGAVEELGEVLRYACSLKCPPPADGRLRPLAFTARPQTIPGEGGFFFVLSREAENAYARVRSATGLERPSAEAELLLVDADGMAGDETPYRKRLPPGGACASYAALAGGLLTGTAFHTALAAWMLGHRTLLPAPDSIGPAPKAGQAAPRRISCFKLNCAGEGAGVDLFVTEGAGRPLGHQDKPKEREGRDS